MKQYLIGICFITATLLLSQTGWAVSQDLIDLDHPSWSLSDTIGEVSVYTRSYPKSNIKAFKARATIELPLAQIIAAMAEPGSAARWIDQCLNATTLVGPRLNNRVSYTLNNLPWPFSNRDVVARVITSSPNNPNEIIINISSANEIDQPEHPDAVRIKTLNARYRLRALSPELTEFVWSQHTEPAGYLPDWLINAKLIEIPSLSIPKLISLASNERYIGAQIMFDENLNFSDVTLANGLQISTLFPILAKHSSTLKPTSEK